MITYASLSKRPKYFHRFTGLTHPEFDELLDKFKSGWDRYIRINHINKERKRAYGGGNTPTLETLEDKLLFILIYVRMYPLLFLHGYLFGLAESNTCVWVHRLLPLVDIALGYAHKRPARGKGRGLDELIQEFPELKELGLLGDGVERPIRRAKNKDKQKATYTGKKKRHTRKNVIITRPDTNEVLYLGKTHDGTIHDKTAMDKEQLSLTCRDPVTMGTDLGFEGLKIKNMRLVMPMKKPKGKELTDLQKGQNRVFSSLRVRVEHAICGVKRNRSVADTYRNIKEGTDDVLISIACGLHNLRVTHRYSSS